MCFTFREPCCLSKESDGATDIINLGQKVPMGPVVPVVAPSAEEEKVLPEWSEKVAHGILTGNILNKWQQILYHILYFRFYILLTFLGASWLSWGLTKGAEYTGIAIQKGASKLREHIKPDDKPTEVSATVTKSLQVAKQATGGAVKVSQFLGKCNLKPGSTF